MKLPAPVFALGSAFLFAAGIPSTKLLVAHVDPKMLAALLYLGSGTGISCILLFRDLLHGKRAAHTVFNRKDFGWLAGSTTLGGILAPLSLLVAMATTPASTVSLLLNFEIVFTALIACQIFKERLGRRAIIGLTAILLGGICLSGATAASGSWSSLFAVIAALCWAIDSNLCGQITHAEPLQIARFKGLVAGAFNFCVAFILGCHLPQWGAIAGAAVTGVLSYGLSCALFIVAIRRLGAARAVAYFSTEPFIGALLSVIILREAVSLNLLMAGILMSVGVWLHLTEKHEHLLPPLVPTNQ